MGRVVQDGDTVHEQHTILFKYKLSLFFFYNYYYYLHYFKAVLTQRLCMIQKDRNTRDHSAWTMGNGDPMHKVCISHRIPRAWEQEGRSKRKKQTQE